MQSSSLRSIISNFQWGLCSNIFRLIYYPLNIRVHKYYELNNDEYLNRLLKFHIFYCLA